MPPKIVVFHHRRSFSPFEVFEQIARTADLIWLVDTTADESPALPRLLAKLGTVVATTGMDLDQIAASLSAHRPDGIVTFVDAQLATAAGVAARLGLPHLSPDVANTILDKRLQRTVLDKAGVPQPRFCPLPRGLTAAEVAELANQMSYPAVLKPAQGSGGTGVRLVRSAQELGALIGPGGSPPLGYLLEELLLDDPTHPAWASSELVVESVVSAGRTSHVTITGRFPLAEPFLQTGSFVPEGLAPPLRRRVLELVSNAIEALGVTSAVTHTEVKLTPDGPKVVEVNGRLGGIVPFILGRVSDVNLFQVACKVAIGSPVPFDGLAQCSGVAFWLRFIPPVSARRVVSIEGLDQLVTVPQVDTAVLDKSPGEAVDAAEGTSSVVATVRGRASDHDDLARTIGLVRATLDIRYE
jgi:biotin carboxylase